MQGSRSTYLLCAGLAAAALSLADGRVLLNEVETMPGFTSTSMFPLLWQASGLSYPELVERLVQLALDRSTGLR